MGIAAFQVLDSANDRSTPPASPVPTSPSADDAAPETDYSIVGAAQLYGPGRWALPADGDSDAPLAVLDVPDGLPGP